MDNFCKVLYSASLVKIKRQQFLAAPELYVSLRLLDKCNPVGPNAVKTSSLKKREEKIFHPGICPAQHFATRRFSGYRQYSAKAKGELHTMCTLMEESSSTTEIEKKISMKHWYRRLYWYC